MPAVRGPALSGAGQAGQFGFAWSLGFQILGWVISGIGLGMSVADAVADARKKKDIENPGATLSPSDLVSTAQKLALADPSNDTEYYVRLLQGKFGPDAPKCPVGFYLDPATSTCVPIKKAGIFTNVPGWGWVIIGIGGFFVVTQMGILKIAR